MLLGRQRRDSYRHHEEEEPEWFSEGPTSQNDRIELHGFEGPREVAKAERSKCEDDDDTNMDTGFDEEYHEEAQGEEEEDKDSKYFISNLLFEMQTYTAKKHF